MKIAVVREAVDGETRVAIVPEVVSRLTALGHQVLLEPGAGVGADFPDEAYAAAGATVRDTAASLADLVVSLHPLGRDRLRRLRRGVATVSLLPVTDHALVVAHRDTGVSALSLLQVPRTAGAQAVDAVTSQAMVAGYRGAVVAAGMLRRFLPLNMTAAGTVPAAKVLVLGAGVAGLQAISTARRWGADVTAYDVRAGAADEVRSVGAGFLDLGLEQLSGESAHARVLSEEQLAKLQDALADHVATADAVITTACVPGHRPPVLVTRAAVSRMTPGSVVVDLAADAGGNTEGVVAGSVVRIGEAQVWGGANVPGQMPGPASTLLAGNMLSLIEQVGAGWAALADKDPVTDPMLKVLLVTRGGEIVHEPTRLAIEGERPAPAAEQPAAPAARPSPLVEEAGELAPDDLTEDELIPEDGDLDFYERPELRFTEDAGLDR